ncbi:cation:proton antiporter [Vaginella massiliensis]|uniref:cation:proton antiporter n=1 Tax=Vaginella massiliensis TaxID=1816680 RepID=UPI0008387253|nr:cation:proton antiporter [Vaginella massiliensis]
MEGHLPKLIVDLALILGVGAITTIIFKRINQPLVLGFIIAGFLVGPHFEYIPNVADAHNVEILAKIGVIFLLFSLGLEFSFKKLLNVGGAASITALFEIICICTVGYFAGQALGWSQMDSIFLGGLLASSSTTIIIRAFEELGLKRKKFASVVFGILIVEDIVVILLMVMLSTLAISQQFNGSEMFGSLLKLLFFLIIWFVAGIFVIPSLLRSLKKHLDDEALLILSIGLCFGMVFIADSVGFSIELGAFVMGSILAETVYAERIEHTIASVKNLFATIFFVSIGMMIDPAAMYEHRWAIFVVTLITIVGKLLFTGMGALISGQPLKQSVQVGMSMAQIGEFAFIVASLGLTLGVTSDFLFPVAVGVSAITTFTTPYLIKLSEPTYEFLNRNLPPKFIHAISVYSTDTQHIQDENSWKKHLKKTFTTITINTVLIIAITLAVEFFVVPYLFDLTHNLTYAHGFGLALALLISIPFVWAILGDRPTKNEIQSIWNESPFNRGPIITITAIRIIILISLILFIYHRFFDSIIVSLIFTLSLGLVMYLINPGLRNYYKMLTNRFVFNLNEREIQSKKSEQKSLYRYTWDNTHISEINVPKHIDFAGKTLEELNWRKRFNINIVYIKRGGNIIQMPSSSDVLFSNDILGIIGTDEQIQGFEQYIKSIEKLIEASEVSTDLNITMDKVAVPDSVSAALCKNVGWVKDKAKGLVVAIERNGEMIYNPDRNIPILEGDYITIVADKKNLREFIQENHLK